MRSCVCVCVQGIKQCLFILCGFNLEASFRSRWWQSLDNNIKLIWLQRMNANRCQIYLHWIFFFTLTWWWLIPGNGCFAQLDWFNILFSSFHFCLNHWTNQSRKRPLRRVEGVGLCIVTIWPFIYSGYHWNNSNWVQQKEISKERHTTKTASHTQDIHYIDKSIRSAALTRIWI